MPTAKNTKAHPAPPAHVVPCVDPLGTDLAIEFPLRFGAAELHLSKAPQSSRLVAFMGPAPARRLAAEAHRMPRRVPLASPRIAATLASRGVPIAEIARRVRASNVAVRKWLRVARRRH